MTHGKSSFRVFKLLGTFFFFLIKINFIFFVLRAWNKSKYKRGEFSEIFFCVKPQMEETPTYLYPSLFL